MGSLRSQGSSSSQRPGLWSISRFVTRSGWRRRASSRRWAASAILTTMRLLSRSSGCTRPRLFIAVAPGENSMMSSFQLLNGSIGSTIAGCCNRLATCRRRSSNCCIIINQTSRLPQPDSTKTVSGNPGAIHDVIHDERALFIGF